jgi:DNA-binding NarL/FixJ family response regulator
MNILVADDSLAVYERLVEILASVPDVNIICHTTDVASTLRCFAERQPDAVILDLHMPGGSGIEVLKSIKRDKPGTPVAVLTSFPYPQYRMICRKLGAEAFLDKSMEFDKVPALIREFAEMQKAQAGALRAVTRMGTHSRPKPKAGRYRVSHASSAEGQ